ncbi:hypothetical protein D9G73_14635 [Escherichia coli]|nr:hypothetical protein [Escherichia coli]
MNHPLINYINIMYQQVTLIINATINKNTPQGPKKNAGNVPTSLKRKDCLCYRPLFIQPD